MPSGPPRIPTEAPEMPHGTDQDQDAAYVLRRQLRFRSWHRGTKEADLLLGTFADAQLERMTADQLQRFSELLAVPDADLYDWATGRSPVPAEYDTDVMALLKAHRVADHLR